LRLSDEGGARWNQDFVVKELKKLEESPKRVWVCGPPVMNEGLDMIFKVAGE
jgi:NAD(P)H-flavin reductase